MKARGRLAILAMAAVPMAGLALGLGGQPGQPASAPAKGPGGMGPEMAGKLAQGLRNTPGCLGVEMGQFMSGKMVIFAWFEDKKAVMEWYNNPVHAKAMDSVAPDRDKDRVPMADVPETGPIMAVASITRPAPGEEGGPMKLGIELYSALPGGARVAGGGFAPDAFRALAGKPGEHPDAQPAAPK